MAKSSVLECIIAARPWSFTASIIPIILTAAVLGHPIYTFSFFRVICMGIFIQAGANLSNTYYDYVNGVDSKLNEGGDNTLVDKKLSVNTIVIMSAICYALGTLSVLPDLMKVSTLFWIFLSGALLAFFYTATPVGLKYQALGDLTIFLCFGPLLMQGASLVLTGNTHTALYTYAIPIGLITENILHANNVRDMKIDSDAGITTLAILVGYEHSYSLFRLFFLTSYVGAIYISIMHHWGCIFTLLTVPICFNLCKLYKSTKLAGLPEETAKFHMLFGILNILGVYFTHKGII